MHMYYISNRSRLQPSQKIPLFLKPNKSPPLIFFIRVPGGSGQAKRAKAMYNTESEDMNVRTQLRFFYCPVYTQLFSTGQVGKSASLCGGRILLVIN